jgi:hypothetical protein
VRDDRATIPHLMSSDHQHLTDRYAVRDFRLTDAHGRVMYEILS